MRVRILLGCALASWLASCSGAEGNEAGADGDTPRSEDIDSGASSDGDGDGDGSDGDGTVPDGMEGDPSNPDVAADDDDPAAMNPDDPGAEDPSDETDPMADDPTMEEADCGPRAVPSQPLRRLSSEEYRATIVDLFGEDLGGRLMLDSRFPETLIRSGFSTDAEANVVNTAESNAIEDEAERIATLVDDDPDAFLRGLLPCALSDPPSDSDVDGCIDAFITDFGSRTYRRPVTESEATIARSLYDGLRADEPARFAFAGLVQFFVQSPALLYRVERGSGEPEGDLMPLSGYERATRLSYLLHGTMPDDTLFAAAEAGELATAEQVLAQAERLLDDGRFFDVLSRFHRDWLELHGFDYKEPGMFPDFEAARGSLEAEPRRFARQVMEAGDGSIASLLGSTNLVVNDVLAAYYGIDAPGAGPDTWVSAEAPNRPGLVTRGAVMATLADSTATSPIHRGGFFQTQILCRELPALPGNVDIQGPLQDTSDLPTARERLAPLLERGECSSCHSIINPSGLAFENYDAAGQWRDAENGSTIDASGTVTLDGEAVDFQDAVELMQAVSQSDEARDCYALNWFRSALGRPEFQEDACSVAEITTATAAAGGDVREMLLALVQTDAFLHRRVEP